jgi:predicted phosphodiesterase
MKNTETPTFILTADIHLRSDNPICRLDNYAEEAQWEKLKFISKIQKRYDCPVLHAGDLFNHWKPSPELLSKTIENIPNKFWTVYGNHDLPQHSMELANKCGVYTLQKAEKVTILNIGHWNYTPKPEEYSWQGQITDEIERKILVWHKTVYQEKEDWMDSTSAMSAKRVLKKYPQYDLIVTGDNHQSFVEQYKGRLLVNVGSMTRSTASQIEYQPRIFLWYAETNTVKSMKIPIKADVISREHLEEVEKRDSRIDSFVNSLNGDWDSGLTFEENLALFEQKNTIRQSVMQIIYKSIDHVSI